MERKDKTSHLRNIIVTTATGAPVTAHHHHHHQFGVTPTATTAAAGADATTANNLSPQTHHAAPIKIFANEPATPDLGLGGGDKVAPEQVRVYTYTFLILCS